MTAEIKKKDDSGSELSFTITLNSLANGNARESTAVDFTGSLFLELLCRVTVKLVTGSPSSDKAVYVYAYGSNNGSTYTYPATGSDAAITVGDPTGLRLICTIPTLNSGGLTYPSQPFAFSPAFGLWLPRKGGIVVWNKTGLDFDSSGCTAGYDGLTQQIV